MKQTHWILSASAAALALTLTACGGGGSGDTTTGSAPPSESPTAVEGVSTPSSVSVVTAKNAQ